MERENSWQYLTSMGLELRRGWQLLADRYSLPIIHSGLPALAGYSIDSQNSLAYKTLITQQMLKRGFLAGSSCYLSLAHTSHIVALYLEVLDSVFSLIQECESGRPVEDLLDGPICHSGFKRLN